MRWALAEAEAGLVSALRLGDVAEIERASERRREAGERHETAVVAWAGSRPGARRAERADRRAGQPPGAAGGTVLAGVDQGLPIALLPVRLETRFAGPDDAPVLKVRIFPDDLHVDDHEPDLSQEEVDQGREYWTAVRAGTDGGRGLVGAELAAGALSGAVGARAAATDRRRQPADVPRRDAATVRHLASRGGPSPARPLPGAYARSTGPRRSRPGSAVADSLQVGVDLSGSGLPPTTNTPDDPTRFGDDVVVLGEEARWLSDFEAAVAAGMAVEVPLPANTRVVDEVAVAGVCVSLTPDDAGALVEDLLDRHRVTHGAGFVPPGTPTNNLADSTSGWSDRPDPARLDPASRPVPGDSSNAAVLGRALGLDTEHLAGLVGATDADSAEAGVMARALFEATWGPYLRLQAQPGFPLALLFQVQSHVTTWLRGGGPLPALRLGRQPYGVLPVQPRQTSPARDDDAFTRWLVEHLPQLRPLWLAGLGQAPSGVAAYGHEPVSSRVRVRTANASSTRPWAASLGLAEDESDPGVRERRLVAELGLGQVLPRSSRSCSPRTPSTCGCRCPTTTDLDFLLVAPKPKDATSILGLLLRNAALQLTDNVADELLTRSPTSSSRARGLADADLRADQAGRGRGQRDVRGDPPGARPLGDKLASARATRPGSS